MAKKIVAEPPPTTVPTIPPLDPKTGDNTVSVFEELALILDALQSGSTLQVGSTAADNYTSEMVVFETTNISGSTVSYTVQRDGFILGWLTSNSNKIGISVNVDLPASAVVSPGSVLPGLVWLSDVAVSVQLMQAAIRYPLLTGDIIKVRTYQATALQVWMFLGYPLLTG
jgi:hypothetical protein